MTRRTAARRAFDAAFVEAMTAMLHRLGARPHPSGWYALRMHTLAGELEISVQDGWLATRFADLDRAKALLKLRSELGDGRLNPFSGKWNFHFGPEDRIEDAVALVEAELRTVAGAPLALADAEVHSVLCRYRANVNGHDRQVVRYRCAQGQEGIHQLVLGERL